MKRVGQRKECDSVSKSDAKQGRTLADQRHLSYRCQDAVVISHADRTVFHACTVDACTVDACTLFPVRHERRRELCFERGEKYPTAPLVPDDPGQ